MKKLMVTALSLLLLSGCARGAAPSSQASSTPASSVSLAEPASLPLSQSISAQSPEGTIQTSYGSFSIAPGWAQTEELSQGDMLFFLQEGTPLDKPTTNISVSQAANKYSQDDYQSFAKAIDAQIERQITDNVVNYTGAGGFTDQDLPLITITVEEKECLTVQYYIVGDHRFVLVQMTDYYDENIPEPNAVALEIVNSFTWAQ